MGGAEGVGKDRAGEGRGLAHEADCAVFDVEVGFHLAVSTEAASIVEVAEPIGIAEAVFGIDGKRSEGEILVGKGGGEGIGWEGIEDPKELLAGVVGCGESEDVQIAEPRRGAVDGEVGIEGNDLLGRDFDLSERGDIGEPDVGAKDLEAVLDMAGGVGDGLKAEGKFARFEGDEILIKGREIGGEIANEGDGGVRRRQGVVGDGAGKGDGFSSEGARFLDKMVGLHVLFARIPGGSSTLIPEFVGIPNGVGAEGEGGFGENRSEVCGTPTTGEDKSPSVLGLFKDIHEAEPILARINLDDDLFASQSRRAGEDQEESKKKARFHGSEVDLGATTAGEERKRGESSEEGGRSFGNGRDLDVSKSRIVSHPDVGTGRFEAVLNVTGGVVDGGVGDAEGPGGIKREKGFDNRGKIGRKILDEGPGGVGSGPSLRDHEPFESDRFARQGPRFLNEEIRLHQFVSRIPGSTPALIPKFVGVADVVGAQGEDGALEIGDEVWCPPTASKGESTAIFGEFKDIHVSQPGSAGVNGKGHGLAGWSKGKCRADDGEGFLNFHVRSFKILMN